MISGDPTPAATAAPASAATVVELAVDGARYRMALPHAASDYIQKKIATERVPYEHEMLGDLRRRVQPGDLVVDVGANVGNHAIYLAAVAGCTVAAFEPNVELCAAMRESAALNGLGDRVQVHAVGIGRIAGLAHFEKSLPDNLGAQRLALGDGGIDVVALDSVAFGAPVRVLKVDVEGMEMDALEGARATIARDRPAVYVECITERAFRDVSRWLEALGYTPWAVFNATPTHLFLPSESVTIEQRLARLQAVAGQDEYRNQQLLREIRQRLSQALEREKQARAALDSVERSHAELRLRHAGDLRTLQETSSRADSLGAQRDELQRQHNELQRRHDELQRRRDELQGHCDQLQAAWQDEGARRVAAEQALAEAHERVRQVESNLAASSASLAELERQLETARDEFASARRALQVELEGERAALLAQTAALAELHARGAAQAEAAAQLRSKLEHAAEVKQLRLEAIERRAAALVERNERLQRSASFRLGRALVAAGSSLEGVRRLPGELWSIVRDGRLRRRARQSAAALPDAASAVPEARLSAAPAPAARPAAPPSPPAPPAARTPPAAPAVPAAHAPHDPPAQRPLPADLRQLKVASVMDEFTFHSFAPECRLLPLRPHEWEAQLEAFRPDLVFIESAWRGADDLWTLKVSNASPEIMGVIDWARRHGVPSAFWNKEDPVHFGGFQHLARAVDYVFTTDIDCIARYKRAVGHERVFLLPFAAQPKTHNPIERFERQDAFCFAGSYYLKYPERQHDFRSLLDVVTQLRPVEIYDRNYHKPHPHYEFPPEYRPYIVGSLPFDQIDKAYKGYRFGINMNTIKQSQTMFARRVFELLACNTVVVSNYSRGVRLMFGDLVVSSDAPAELRRRLDTICADETWQRRFRLAGVRKVLSEHTYAHRLAYIASKFSGGPAAPVLPEITVLAHVASAQAAARVAAQFGRQTHTRRRLVLVGSPDLASASATVVAPGDGAALQAALAGADWVAPWVDSDHHGANYLLDLALATRYSAAPLIGKAAHYVAVDGRPVLRDDGRQYRENVPLPARSAMVRADTLASLALADATAVAQQVLDQGERLAIDEFNYCREGALLADSVLAELVDDLPGLRTGLASDSALLAPAEAIRASDRAVSDADEPAQLPGRSAAELAQLLARRAPGGVAMALEGEHLVLRSRLPAEKHVYVYAQRVFPRAELNLEFNSRIELRGDSAELDLRTVFEFLDAEQRKISHSIARTGAPTSMAIPAHCRFVRVGLRVQGPGVARIERLVLGDLRERPNALLAGAKHLVLAKQYPAYDDLYRYGFVHSRMRAYRQRGVDVDVFRINAEEPCRFREFENIDVTQGDRDLLDLALRTGGYETVLVHLLDTPMWEAVRGHLDRLKVIIWVHGAEIQKWSRRGFDEESLPPAEIDRRIKLGEQRVQLWREVLSDPHPNLHFVFVSDYLAEQAVEDIGVARDPQRWSVIHNLVDDELFARHPKDPAQRFRVLSVRPYSGRIYGNDLAVEAIRLLAQRPVGAHLTFRLVGDGEQFDSTTAPLAGLPNVTLERRFLTQSEIAALHRDFGVFLVPSRMDTQGVSRGEAMASGLVPVTTRVAAIPEFVDADSGLLVDAEDAAGLADAIERLAGDPALFERLSHAAAERVRGQCGPEQTVARELALLHSVPAPAGHAGP